MTKIIKGEFEKLVDAKVEDVSLTCDTSLEVFNNEFNRISGMDDDLFTYEIEVANFPCNSNMNDDSEHEADDDMGYDPSDVAFTEWFELKGQFLKELRENTFSGLDNEDANEHLECFEIVDFMQVLHHMDQLMLRVFPISYWSMLEGNLFLQWVDVPTRHILDSRGTVPTKTVEDVKKAIQEMAEYSQKCHNGTSRGRNTETSDGLAAI
ncbi:hypothetical protein Tco_0138085 [Tanacetum coccineum]